jgi:hypothetical protein
MPLTTVLVLAGIVAAFGIFGIVLAWAERQTRNIYQDRPAAHAQKNAVPPDDRKLAA